MIKGGRAYRVGLAGAILVSLLSPRAGAIQLAFDQTPAADSPGPVATYAPIVDKVAPAVVTIYTTKVVKLEENLPAERKPFWHRFLTLPRPKSPIKQTSCEEQKVSSGVIVSKDGHVLTSNHVVENASRIEVTLSDKRSFKPVIVGVDPATDLAVLKIEATNLHAIVFADSDQVRPGDVALTAGNPFGVGQTISFGIVSATGREGFGILEYEDFIQTDANIHPGNSGGALLDARGRLIGINTAIMSFTGAGQGIGFSIPSNLARHVAATLIEQGRVQRGYFGIVALPLDADVAKLFRIDSASGAVIASVERESPAAKAGLRPGDVLLELNDRRIRDSKHLRMLLAHIAPDRPFSLKIVAGGQQKIIKASATAKRQGVRSKTPAALAFH